MCKTLDLLYTVRNEMNKVELKRTVTGIHEPLAHVRGHRLGVRQPPHFVVVCRAEGGREVSLTH